MDLDRRVTPAFDDDVWELYNVETDWSQANDLSKQMPEKLHELQRLWLIEATRYNVLPLDDNLGARLNADTAGRPQLIKGKSQILFGSMGRLSENSVINIKNKSHSVTAEIVVPATGPVEGVIVAQGGNIGGWSIYAKDGKLKYCYNFLGIHYFYVESTDPLPAGQHQVRMEFAYAGGGLGKGGVATLFIDGKQAGAGPVAFTAAMIFSADDGCDVGRDTGSPVSPDYKAAENGFTGTVKGVQIAIAEDAVSSITSSNPRKQFNWRWHGNKTCQDSLSAGRLQSRPPTGKDSREYCREKMKSLLIVTALIEGATGLLLLAAPSVVTRLLLDSSLDGSVPLIVARLTGLALLTLTVACWLARLDGETRAANGLVTAMVLYNVGAAALLAYAGIALRLSGIFLWPVVLLHAVMAAWCVISLKRRPAKD